MGFIKKRTIFPINEGYKNEKVFIKIVSKEDWENISTSGIILPLGKIENKGNVFMGNWTIPESNVEKWAVPVKSFGSPLQALMMLKTPNTDMCLLRIKISDNNHVYNRDITKMFIDYTFKGYFTSWSKEKEYEINESFITGEIEDFELINEFTIPEEMSKLQADPNSVLDFIYGKSECKFTDKKMDGVLKKYLKIVLSKILTLNFKDIKYLFHKDKK